MKELNLYVVGGAVRDVLLGLRPKDIDYVVVGSTPEEMLELGFKQVGADFPVFLNSLGDEYALARTERKIASGYHGFEVQYDSSVTLTDDLCRRDLTMNAMAVALNDWPTFIDTRNPKFLIDPSAGRYDLDSHILRHVSSAFAEDPLRVLRVARFRGRYGFSIASSTASLMATLINQGEIASLTPERVWIEFEKGLVGRYADLFINTLYTSGALDVLVPEFSGNGTLPIYALEKAALLDAPLNIRFAAMFSGVETSKIDDMFLRLKAPVAISSFVKKFAIVRDLLENFSFSAQDCLMKLTKLDVFKHPEKIVEIARAFKMTTNLNESQEARLMELLVLARETAAITFATLDYGLQQSLKGKAISDEINRRRLIVLTRRRGILI